MFDLLQTIIINKKLGIPPSIIDIIGKYYITNPFYLDINIKHISSNGKLYYDNGCLFYNNIKTNVITDIKRDKNITSIECNDEYIFIGRLYTDYIKQYIIERYKIEDINKTTRGYNIVSIPINHDNIYKKFHLCNDTLIYNGIRINCNTLEKFGWILCSYKTDKYYFVRKDKYIVKYDLNNNLIKQYPIKNYAIKFYEKNDLVYCFDGTTLICLN